MTGLFLFFVFIAGAAGAALLFLWTSGLRERLAQRRLEARLQQMQPAEAQDSKSETIIKGTVEGPLPSFDRLIGGTTKGFALGRWIQQSGVKKATVSGVLLVALGLAALGVVSAAVLTHTSIGMAIGALMGFSLPFLVLKMKRSSRFSHFEEQFPEALDLIARSLKAGHAFSSGLKMVADELDEPVGPEFRKTFDEQNFGLPLKDALENLCERIPLLDVRFFATAVLIQRETGGNLAEILENLAHVVRERFKILRQVRVYTAHGRLTGYVLLGLPVALAIALMFINPDHMNMLFRDRMGQTMLMVAAGMQFAGYMWIRKIVKIEV